MIELDDNFGDIAGLFMVTEELSDDQIQKFLTCQDISEMGRKSILKEFKRSENIEVSKKNLADMCNDNEKTELKFFETKGGALEGKKLCLGLGGHISFSFEELLDHGEAHGCLSIRVPNIMT